MEPTSTKGASVVAALILAVIIGSLITGVRAVFPDESERAQAALLQAASAAAAFVRGK